jgi:putative nucleotidyltransferase with HDIG domain
MKLSARLIVLLTTFAGGVVVVASASVARSLPAQTAALLAIAAVLTELMQIRAGGRPGVDEPDFSFSSGVLIAAIIAVGPLHAALIVPLAVGLVDELRGSPRPAVAFNASAFALTAVAAGGVYKLAGGTVGTVSLPGQLPQLLLLTTTAYAVNLLFVEGIVSASLGRSLRHLAVATARGQVLSATSEAGFGVALAYFLIRSPWAILTLVPLVIAVFKAHARLELQRRETTRALETFATVVDERDRFTSHHSLRVAETVHAFAEWLGRSPEDALRLRWAGRLHDLGKITVDSAILHKPARLDESEWEAVRAHPRLSARLLRRFSLASEEARAVELHHERYDGTGYYGVPGDRVPLAAHLLVIADTFDAVTNDRPYRAGLPLDEALEEIARGSGTQFHPTLAKAFVAFKRGTKAADVLDERERALLDELWRVEGDASPRASYRPGPAAVTLSLTLVALAAWGLGLRLAAVALAASAAVAAARVIAAHERMWRLVRRLGAALATGDLRSAVAEISAFDRVRFATISSAKSAAPAPLVGADTLDGAALRAWLAANADLDSVACLDGAAAGTSGSLVGLPIGEDTWLLLHFDAPPSASVRRALERCLPDFRTAVPEPAPLSRPQPRLTAIA